MGLRFRKSFGIGPVRTNISKGGIGSSIRFFGFRFGVSADGKNTGVSALEGQVYIISNIISYAKWHQNNSCSFIFSMFI